MAKGLPLKQNVLKARFLKWLNARVGWLWVTETFYSLSGPVQDGTYTLIRGTYTDFSHLCESLSKACFIDKYLFFYFGSASGLGPEHLVRENIDFESMLLNQKKVYCIRGSPKSLTNLGNLLQNKRDWWLLTQSQKPTSEALEDKGFMAGPSATRSRLTPLDGELLINYFADPSIQGLKKPQFMRLFQKQIFQAALTLTPYQDKLPQHWQELKVEDLLSQDLFPQDAAQPHTLDPHTTRIHHFVLKGGRKPSITRADWPGGKRFLKIYLEGRWLRTHHLEEGPIDRFTQLMGNYVIPAILLPITIIIIPLTLVLWGLKKLGSQILRMIMEESDAGDKPQTPE